MNAKIRNTLFACFVSVNLFSQQIVSGEYFFDTAPALGGGTAFTVTPSADLNHTMSIPTISLSAGFHNLFIRVKNNLNIWSHYEGRIVYIMPPQILTTPNLVSGEYFMDTDPGLGNGTAISFNAGTDVSPSLTVPTSNLASGIHNLFIRVKNSAGKWSHYEGRMFYVMPTISASLPNIVSGEYFIDTDPGLGNGSAISFTAATTVSPIFNINTSSLSSGFHNLFIRVKNSAGKWSHYEGRMFYIMPNVPSTSPSILNGEYFVDTDPGLGNGTAISFISGTDISPIVNVNIANLALGNHNFFIRVKNSEGKWSHYEGRSIRICETYGPMAAFTPIISGNSVSFQNASQYATLHNWSFGDGTTSTMQYPVHTFEAGAYEVRLVSSNTCGIDTAFASLELEGLNHFTPTRGGNTGLVTMSLHGYGFDSTTVVKLVRAGQAAIGSVDNLIAVESPTSATVTFDLNGALVGEWNVRVEFVTGGEVFISEAPFIIEEGDTEYNLTVALIGSPIIRGSGTYSLQITNASNIDASYIPLEIIVSDTLGSIELIQELITYGMPDSLASDSLYSFTYSIDEGVTYNRYYYIYIPFVSAYSSNEIPIRIVLPVGSTVRVETNLGDPILLDIEAIEELMTLVQELPVMGIAQIEGDFLSGGGLRSNCNWDAQYRQKLKNLAAGLSLTAITIGLIPGLQPVALLFGGIAATAAMANYYLALRAAVASGENENVKKTAFDAAGALASGLGAINGLGKAAAVAAGREAVKANPISRAVGTAGASLGAANNAAATLSSATGCPQPIPGGIFNGNSAQASVTSVGSFDPNEKHGPVGLFGQPYYNGRTALYTIFFENVDTATAAAQLVHIIDTLDNNLFDLSTVQLRAIGIADSLHAVPSDRVGNYFTDLNFAFLGPLTARVNFTVDSASAVVECRFLSLDDNTMDFTQDPLAGFLPPNVTPPMGEGFIAFSVNLKEEIGSGATASNRASIIFDTNEPIITNTHTYTTDFNRPTSSVGLLPDTSSTLSINVSWAGNDQTSSTAYHDVFVKEKENGSWSTIAYHHLGTSTSFTGEWGKQYSFFSLATDLAGNKEILDTTQIRTTVLWPEALVLSFHSVSITCADSNNATLTVEGIGGQHPYTYLWSTGDTTSIISELGPGEYSVTITDSFGSEVDTSFVVLEPPSLILSINVDSPLTCQAGATTQLTASASGGVSPYYYHWGGLDFWPTLANIGSGSYTVILADANGCVRIDSVLLTSPSNLTADFLATSTTSCEGSIAVTPSGGIAPYSILWSDGLLSGFNLSGLCPGSYNAIIEDAEGCSVAISVVVENIASIQVLGQEGIRLLPNPTTGMISISGYVDSDSELNIEIRNTIGQVLVSKSFNQHSGNINFMIDISHLSQGIYLATVKYADFNMIERLIKVAP